MKLIQENPYRIVGILSNATAREIQGRKSKITAYAKDGRQVSSEFDFPFLNNIEKDQNSIEKAFSAIQQSKEMLDELFEANGGEFRKENRGGYLYAILLLLVAITGTTFFIAILLTGEINMKLISLSLAGAIFGFSTGLSLLYKSLKGKYRREDDPFTM